MKKDLKENKNGRIVSRKSSSQGKKRFNKGLKKWCQATAQARKELGITGFKAVKKGTRYYKLARKIYDELK